ncbi:MAG TPA: hypothetical protein VFX30_06860 [bacterium]|nr:hypothetical protein [bacterium]
MVTFLLPSLKLKEPCGKNQTFEERLHDFLLKNFNGYTASAANLFGYWRNHKGREFYGEHKEYKVSLLDESRIVLLETFLARIGADMGEKSVYLAAGDDSWLIFPDKSRR